MNKKALTETAKELARIALLGAISAVLSWVATKVASLPPDSAYAVLGTIILRLLDKYIHKSKDNDAKGLVPF